MAESYLHRMKGIRLLVLDVDGVLTDGKVYITPDNQIMRSMHTRDGLAVKRAVERGYRVVIISGGRDANILPRLRNLGVRDIFLHTDDKWPVLGDFMRREGFTTGQTAYMGDDIPDIAPMQHVGLAACPANAAPEVKAVAHYISPHEGGAACVRDLIEKILRINGDWF